MSIAKRVDEAIWTGNAALFNKSGNSEQAEILEAIRPFVAAALEEKATHHEYNLHVGMHPRRKREAEKILGRHIRATQDCFAAYDALRRGMK